MSEGQVVTESTETAPVEESVIMAFLRAWQTSETTKEVSEKTGKTVATCSAYASKLRQTEYRMKDKVDKDDNTVYKSKVAGEETTDKAKAATHGGNGPQSGKPKVIRVFQKDASGQKIVKRKGIPLKKMPKGGGGESLDWDAAMALIDELAGN